MWRQPERYAEQFARFGWRAVIEPDFSLWTDAPLVEQLWNVYRTRWLGRHWQEAGLNIIPSLNWADERSFAFCFLGIPQHAPAVAVECRTAGQTDDERRAFLTGLAEGVRQAEPAHVVIYGGQEHAFWLASCLPLGPQYTLLESWTRARGRGRRNEEQQLRHRNQIALNLSTKGGAPWAAEAQVAAAQAVAAPT